MQIGTPRDLYDRPHNPFVADFIGINNLIPGEVQEINVSENWMRVQTKVGPLICIPEASFKPGDRCMITVRPETASINQSREVQEGFNDIAGTVSFAYYIGNTIRYDVEVNYEGPFKVDIQNPIEHKPFSIGERIYVSFPVKTTLGIPFTQSSLQWGEGKPA